VAKLRFSAVAKDDLNAIARCIAETSGSRQVAERFARELRKKCHALADAPIHMGRPRPELRPDLRSHAHGNYLIFFRYLDGDVLEIVNVLEGHRDIGAFYPRDET
jgi:toxin ParE1/3/4